MRRTNKIVREFFYPTQIYIKDLPNFEILNKNLLTNILNWRDRDNSGVKRSNAIGWHSDIDMHKREEYFDIVEELKKMQLEIFELEHYDTKTEPSLGTMWANVSPKFSYNRSHVHPGALWSGVYYVKAPKNSGSICFVDPRPGPCVLDPAYCTEKKRPSHMIREVRFEPLEGRMIMFPGWLPHEVEPNLSEEDDNIRVSISFNFSQIWKK